MNAVTREHRERAVAAVKLTGNRPYPHSTWLETGQTPLGATYDYLDCIAQAFADFQAAIESGADGPAAAAMAEFRRILEIDREVSRPVIVSDVEMSLAVERSGCDRALEALKDHQEVTRLLTERVEQLLARPTSECPIELFIGFKQEDGSYRYAVAEESDFNMNGYVKK